MNEPAASPSPAPVWDVINGFAAYWALHAAVELRLFDALAHGPLDSATLADRVGVADAGDVDVLASLLVAAGLLDTDGERWSATPSAAAFLTHDSPASMARLVRASPGPHDAWPGLATTLAGGRPTDAILDTVTAGYPGLVRSTAAVQRAVAHEVAAAVLTHERPVTIVDFGCGSGVWLSELLDAAAAGSWGIGVDLPTVTPIASDTLSSVRAGRSTGLLDGDYLEVALPVDHADIVVLAHVLRAETPARAEALVERALALLAAAPDSGVLLVADYFVPGPGASGDELRAARHDLTLALTMRACTPGRGLSEDMLRQWCERRGFSVVASLEPIARQRVLVIRPLPEPTAEQSEPS